MNSAEKHIQLNLNNEAKQAKRKAEEAKTLKQIEEYTRELREKRLSAERK